MENEIKTNEEKENTEVLEKSEETKTEEIQNEASETVEEDNNQPISYASSHLEKIETSRAAFLKTYRLQNTLKWIVSFICIAAIVFGAIVVPNLIGGQNGTIAMVAILFVALLGTVLYSVLTKRYINRKMKEYFDTYYECVNSFVFEGDDFQDVKVQSPGKIEKETFVASNLYKDVHQVGSRGLTELKYHDIPVAICDAAAQVMKEKRLIPVFVGKFLYAASNFDNDDPIYIYFKGDKRALPPTNMDGVEVVSENKKCIIYTNNKNWEKYINGNVNRILSSIKMNKELVDLSISLQKGTIYVCMGYDDPLMVLPLQNQFNPRPNELFKADVKNVLRLIEEFNK